MSYTTFCRFLSLYLIKRQKSDESFLGLLFVVGGFTFGQLAASGGKEEKFLQLKNRGDISQRDGFPKATEVEKDLLKLEYPNGKVMYKNIADYSFTHRSLSKGSFQNQSGHPITGLSFLVLIKKSSVIRKRLQPAWHC
jgi:hypothetical protein